MRYLLVVAFIIVSCSDSPFNKKPLDPTVLEGFQLDFAETNVLVQNLSIHFIDESVGFIVNSGGSIARTENRGATWLTVYSATDVPLFDVAFANPLEGIAVGGTSSCSGTNCTPSGLFMLKTIDGGSTWTAIEGVTTASKISLRAVTYAANGWVFAVGTTSILRSKDSGQTWTETVIPNPGSTITDVTFLDDKVGLVSFVSGKVVRTADGGDTWTDIGTDKPGRTFALSKNPDGRVFASGDNIFVSSDQGESWSALAGAPEDINSISFPSALQGFAFGVGEYSGGDFGYNYGSIYITKDGGLTWTGTNKVHESGGFVSSSFPRSDLGFAVSGGNITRVSAN